MKKLHKTIYSLFSTSPRDRMRMLGFTILFAVTGVMTVYAVKSLILAAK